MQIEQGVKNPLVDPGMFTYYPPYNLAISRKFSSKEKQVKVVSQYKKKPYNHFII